MNAGSDTMKLPMPGLKRRFRAAACLLAAAFALALLTAETAQAQTSVTLVSNTGQSSDSTSTFSAERAQPFTTGSNAAGYKLTGVTFPTTGTTSFHVGVRIESSGTDNKPGGNLGALTCAFTASEATCTTDGIDLAASTTYFVVLESQDTSSSGYRRTNSDSEDTGAATGWSIGDGSLWDDDSTLDWDQTSTTSWKLAIKGYAKTAAPAFSSAAVNGTTLTITFDRTLAAAASLANSAFTVKKTPSGGTEATAALSGSPSISGKTVTLTLAAAAVSTDAFTVAYNKPATGTNNKLENAGGDETDTFAAQTVTNNTPPSLPSACTGGGDGWGHMEVTSTSTSIIVTSPSTAGSAPGAIVLCGPFGTNGAITTATVFATATIGPNFSLTITRSGTAATAPLLAAGTDYWVMIDGYVGNSPWWHIRTKSAGFEPTVTVTAGTSPVTEGTAAEFTVTASAAPGADLEVSLSVSEAAGSDFVAAGDEGSQTVTITSGTTTATHSVPTQGDTADEPNGSVTVEVVSGTGYGLGTPKSASVTVNDDDVPVLNLSGAKILSSDRTKLVLLFDAELAAAASLANSAFTVKKDVSGTATAQSLTGSPAISGRTVTLTLASAVASGDTTVTVSYTKPTTGTANKIVSTAGAEAASFTDQAASHNRAPTYTGSGGTSAGNNAPSRQLVSLDFNWSFSDPDGDDLTYSRTETYPDAFTDDTPNVNNAIGRIFGMARTFCGLKAVTPAITTYANASLAGRQVFDNVVTLTATDPYGAKASVTRTFVTTYSPDYCKTLRGAALNKKTLILTLERTGEFTDLLTSNETGLSRSDFTVKVGAADKVVAVESLSVGSDTIAEGAQVTLTLAEEVAVGTAVKVSYAPDDAENPVIEVFTDHAFTVADVFGPKFVSAEVAANGRTLTVTFDEDLDTAHNPGGGSFTVTAARPHGGGTTEHPGGDTSVVSGKTVRVFLNTAVSSEETLTVAYAVPASSQLRDANGNHAAAFTGKPVTNGATADDTAPVFLSAEVNGRTLTLRYDEDLDTGSVPSADSFSVAETLANNTFRSLDGTGVAIADNVVTVTLESAVAHGEGVLLFYYAPDQNALQDAAGNPALNTTNATVVNSTPTAALSTGVAVSSTPRHDADGDNTPDTYVLGTTIRVQVTFGSAVDVDTTGGTPRLKLRLGADDATDRWADYESGSGTTTLTFAYTVAADDVSTQGVAVLKNSLALNGGVITDSGTEVALRHAGVASSAVHKVNGGLEVTPIVPEAAAVLGDTLTLYFDAALDTTSVPAAGDFAVSVAGAARSVSGVAVTGRTVVLTLASAVNAGQAVTVGYTKGTNEIQATDTLRTPVASFSGREVANAAGDTTSPRLVSATVLKDELTLTYSELLDPAHVPPVSRFVVQNNDPETGGQLSVSSVAVRGKAVVLTLAQAVTEAQVAARYVNVIYNFDVEDTTNVVQDFAENVGPRIDTASNQPAGVRLTWGAPRSVGGSPSGGGGPAGGGAGPSQPSAGAPVASAGADRAVDPGAAVTLDGSASSDPDGEALSYAWAQQSGSSVTLAGANAARASFTAPDMPGGLAFTLTVTDPGGLSDSDGVTVTVRDLAPSFGTAAVSSLALVLDEAMEAVVLPEATGGNGALTYSLTSAPAGLAGLDFDAATRRLSGTPDTEGSYTFTYRAHDADDNRTATDAAVLTFAVTVEDPRTALIRKAVKKTLAAVARRALSSALENIGARFASSVPDSGLMLAGESLPFGAAATAGAEGAAGACAVDAFDRHGFAAGSSECLSAETRSRGVAAEELLRNSAFSLTLGATEGEVPPGPRWAIWGRGDLGTFAGRPEPGMRFEGELRTGWLGVDARDGPWVAGLAFSHGTGEADYAYEVAGLSGEGRLETTLNALYPYGRWTFDDGLELRMVLGTGTGEARHRHEDEEPETSDLTMHMASLGVRRELPALGGIDLAVRADGSLARMETGSGPQYIDNLTADTWRGRVGLEASRRIALDGDAALTPFVEAAGRRDGGDGLTGAGLELAGGVRYSAPNLHVEARGRWLAAHAEEGAEERGVSLTARVGPGAQGRGLSLSLSPRWGASTGGAESLWGEEMPSLSGGAGGDAAAVDARIGYGIAAFPAGMLTPFVETGLAGEDSRRLRLGTRFDASGAALGVELAGERRESGGAEPEHVLRLDLGLRF